MLKFLLFIAIVLVACNSSQTKKTYSSFDEYPVYSGDDLGVTYTPEQTTIKLWSPAAEAVKIKIYKEFSGDNLIEEHELTITENGVWQTELKGDYIDKYYTLQAQFEGKWKEENPDPYAKAVGTNGKRGMIIDLAKTNPEGWENDISPEFNNPTDAILYELHVRDLSTHESSGIKNKGTFLAFTEEGTKNKDGLSTGIDHIKELGVTHLHLLPAFDHTAVDESKLEENNFNWGYAPDNYNIPEGSYSSNPEDGNVRIKEFKQMVQAMHKNGIRVVMDVVYNHTGKTYDSNLDQLVPGYYYRQWEDGKYGDASACGNELASERKMVRKFIIESVKYWAKEYHVDGFRFDLMAIHDIETMNQLAAELKKIDPSIIIYGEGWAAQDGPLVQEKRALKDNVSQMKDVAVFSDDIRDAVKGNVFDEKSKGFVNGSSEMDETVKIGIVAACEHPQVDYSKGYYSKKPYSNNPASVVNYVSCHDNQTLYDKLKVSTENKSEEELVKMHKLANTIVLTSQGIPFLHAGVEIKRTKSGEHNSYNKPDSINQINWNWKTENLELFNYYKQLVKLRKEHPAFRMTTKEDIQKHLEFIKTEEPQLIAYKIKDNANDDSWKNILVIFNGSDKKQKLKLPDGDWNVALKEYQFVDKAKTVSGKIKVKGISAVILYQ